MPNLPSTPVPEQPTRFQAQRALGLFAPHDYAMFAAIVVGLFLIAAQWFFVPEPNYLKLLFELLGVLVFALAWLIVLVYRALVFILDFHTVPESVGQIVKTLCLSLNPSPPFNTPAGPTAT